MQNRLHLLATDLPSFPEDYLVLTMLLQQKTFFSAVILAQKMLGWYVNLTLCLLDMPNNPQ